jgi:hypothetical protein
MRTVWVRYSTLTGYSANLFEPSYHLNLPFNSRLVAPMRCQWVALASSLRHHLREGSNELTAVYKEGVLVFTLKSTTTRESSSAEIGLS